MYVEINEDFCNCKQSVFLLGKPNIALLHSQGHLKRFYLLGIWSDFSMFLFVQSKLITFALICARDFLCSLKIQTFWKITVFILFVYYDEAGGKLEVHLVHHPGG